MSAVRIRVAHRDWWASRSVVSVIRSGIGCRSVFFFVVIVSSLKIPSPHRFPFIPEYFRNRFASSFFVDACERERKCRISAFFTACAVAS